MSMHGTENSKGHFFLTFIILLIGKILNTLDKNKNTKISILKTQNIMIMTIVCGIVLVVVIGCLEEENKSTKSTVS